jgi:phosphopantetheine adenylyltransferase
MVRQIATFGGDISPFVPDAIKNDIIKRLDITAKKEDNKE